MRGLYWARTDLRIHDNQALNAFSSECDFGLITWFPSKSVLRAGDFRRDFIYDCLSQFASDLVSRGQNLIVFSKLVEASIEDLLNKHSIEKVYFTESSAVEEVIEEARIKKICSRLNIQIQSFDQAALIHEKDLPFAVNDMPFVFTNFRKEIESRLVVRPPLTPSTSLPKLIVQGTETDLIPQNSQVLFHGGEKAALKRLKEYLWDSNAVSTYKETRNGLLNPNDSTRFSPWLNQGCLSPRQIYSELKSYEAQVQQNESTYWVFFELLWRDYMKYFSKKFKQNIFSEAGVKKSESYRPIEDLELFEAWCSGKTADRFINANMNELNQTGWMSNRGRQNVASYLVHKLNLPWTWGASYFEKMLIDYDPDLNWGNWLYLSGNGSDPRARAFDSERQAKMYDPDQAYQKKFS